MRKKLVVIGSGFSGFWSILSAVRQSRALEKRIELEIAIITPDDYFTMRPRLYEVALEGLRIPLEKYTDPLGIEKIVGTVESVFPEKNALKLKTANGFLNVNYDYLIVASGSVLKTPDIPGAQYTHNVDTFNAAEQLDIHMQKLAKGEFSEEGANTFVIAGGGFTGLEIATCIAEKADFINNLHEGIKKSFNVILIEKRYEIANGYSPDARKYIETALAEKNIKIIRKTEIRQVQPTYVVLSNGAEIMTRTVIWATGMVASTLTSQFKGDRDSSNRLKVNSFLKSPHYKNIAFSGDLASVMVEHGERTAMACQFSNYQGRWAGHNAVNELFGEAPKEYVQSGYVTCLDLGINNALFTRGWDTSIELTGNDARNVKQYINTQLIYPPEDPEEAVAASYPEIPQY